MSFTTQLALALLMGIPLGWCTVMWGVWRIPLGGRLPGDGFLLPYLAVLMFCAGWLLRAMGFDGDARDCQIVHDAAMQLWRDPRV